MKRTSSPSIQLTWGPAQLYAAMLVTQAIMVGLALFGGAALPWTFGTVVERDHKGFHMQHTSTFTVQGSVHSCTSLDSDTVSCSRSSYATAGLDACAADSIAIRVFLWTSLFILSAAVFASTKADSMQPCIAASLLLVFLLITASALLWELHCAPQIRDFVRSSTRDESAIAHGAGWALCLTASLLGPPLVFLGLHKAVFTE